MSWRSKPRAALGFAVFGLAAAVLSGAQVLVLAGAAKALTHGDWVLAGLIIYGLYSTWPVSRVPTELGYLVLAIALFRAQLTGQSTVFLLVATKPILHNARLSAALMRPRTREFWEGYFLGSRRRWRRLAAWWRARGRVPHLAAWAFAVVYGIAWAVAVVWCVFTSDSPLAYLYKLPAGYMGVVWLTVLPHRDAPTRRADTPAPPPPATLDDE